MTADNVQLTYDFINSELRRFDSLNCWSVGLYLGSMFYCDFGSKLTVQSRRGKREVGALSISVRDVFWELYSHGKKILDSDGVDAESFNEILGQIVVGNTLDGVFRSEIALDLRFVDGVLIRIDMTNKWKSLDAIMEISLPTGQVIAMRPNGDAQYSKLPDEQRAKLFQR